MSQSGHLKIIHTQELVIDHNGNHSPQLKQAVELTKEVIQSGLLKSLPGSMLPIYLYILTHIEANFSLTTTLEEMAELVPHTPLEIELALTMLERQKYINLQDADSKFTITLASPPGGRVNDQPSVSEVSQENSNSVADGPAVMRNNALLDHLFSQKAFSEDDLVRAIASMMPAQNLNYGFRQEIDYWFKTFDKEVIKELIRRTDEAWQRDIDLNCQAYMRKIANEWLSEQILTIKDLETSDKVFRQVKSLLEEFGIERQKSMARTHWETVYRWINADSEDDFALSIAVAQYAIKEAIRRKSDGRPSLTYIEDNFIKPFKEGRAKTVEDAERILNQQSKGSNHNKTPDKTNDKKNKWQLGIDFTRFREN